VTDIHDDLLPGDEDAILGDLQRDELNAAGVSLTSDGKSLTAEKMAHAMKVLMKSQTGIADVLRNMDGGFTGGLLNRIATNNDPMPIFPDTFDSGPEAVMPRDRFRWFHNTYPVVSPKMSTIITNVSC